MPKGNLTRARRSAFIRIAHGAKIDGLTATGNTVFGDADFLDVQGELSDVALEGNRHYIPVDHEGGNGTSLITKDGKRINSHWYKSWWMKYLVYPVITGFIVALVLKYTQDDQPKQNAKYQTAQVLVIGGGGSGGDADGGCAGGGGGSGAIVNIESFPIQAGSYKVLVGEGGINGSDGGTSSFNGVINAEGGKGGASGDCVTVNNSDSQK